MTAQLGIATHIAYVDVDKLQVGDKLASWMGPDEGIRAIRSVQRPSTTRPGHIWTDLVVTLDSGEETFHCVDNGASFTEVRRLGHHPSGERSGCRCHEHLAESYE